MEKRREEFIKKVKERYRNKYCYDAERQYLNGFQTIYKEKTMKQFLYNLLLMFILAAPSCHPLVEICNEPSTTDTTEVTVDSTINTNPGMYMKTYEYTAFQLDSMCVTDGLPRTLSEWTKNTLTDYETNTLIIRYVYIKEFNETYEILYIVTPEGEIYIVQKREAIKESIQK